MEMNIAKQMQAFCSSTPFGFGNRPHLLSEPATDFSNPDIYAFYIANRDSNPGPLVAKWLAIAPRLKFRVN